MIQVNIGKLDCFITMVVGIMPGVPVLPCPVIKINGKLQQPNPDRITKGTEPSGIKVWTTPLGKEPRPAEVFAEGRRNTEWVVEEGS